MVTKEKNVTFKLVSFLYNSSGDSRAEERWRAESSSSMSVPFLLREWVSQLANLFLFFVQKHLTCCLDALFTLFEFMGLFAADCYVPCLRYFCSSSSELLRDSHTGDLLQSALCYPFNAFPQHVRTPEAL